MRRARRQLAVAAARCAADERARAVDRAGGDSGPNRAPCQMCDGHAGVRVDFLVGFRQHLLGLSGALEIEARAAGAAHAERVPSHDVLESVIALAERDQDLIGRRRVRRAARGRDDRVGLGAVET